MERNGTERPRLHRTSSSTRPKLFREHRAIRVRRSADRLPFCAATEMVTFLKPTVWRGMVHSRAGLLARVTRWALAHSTPPVQPHQGKTTG
jgi:hypothetical protein